MKTSRHVLAQLVDSEELKALDPTELRDMLAKLDDEVVYGTEDLLTS